MNLTSITCKASPDTKMSSTEPNNGTIDVKMTDSSEDHTNKRTRLNSELEPTTSPSQSQKEGDTRGAKRHKVTQEAEEVPGEYCNGSNNILTGENIATTVKASGGNKNSG